MNIIVTCNGKRIGYVESIYEETNTVSITINKEVAKKYDDVDVIHNEIDILTRINDNFIYLYE